ncbi:MAG: hypothetical protein GC192_12100 [Bacteroidetes bacterium]|nr:hypothetical protein [Bacteroidota bacterium]
MKPLSESNRQKLAYLAIAVVSLASILAYTLESWRWGATIVGIGFLLIGLMIFFSPKDDANE